MKATQLPVGDGVLDVDDLLHVFALSLLLVDAVVTLLDLQDRRPEVAVHVRRVDLVRELEHLTQKQLRTTRHALSDGCGHCHVELEGAYLVARESVDGQDEEEADVGTARRTELLRVIGWSGYASRVLHVSCVCDKKKAHLDEGIEFGFGVDSLSQLRHRLVVASGEEGVRGGVSQPLSPRGAREGTGWRTC
jgi:hypothetical protein